MRKTILSAALVAAFGSTALCGCSTMDETGAVLTSSSTKTLLDYSQEAADGLAKSVGPGTRRILVASVADVNNVERANPFGRMSGEQIASRLAHLGYEVEEAKFRTAMAVTKQGEFALSREVSKIVHDHNVDAIVTGTYAIGGRNVHVSLRLIEADTSRVLGTFDYTVPKDRDVRGLLY